MTEAPYPADTRAKGWRFELDHERIRQSDTWVLASPDIRPWLLMLWMTAWEQTPCGSMPADDGLIAARIGMQRKTFDKQRSVLMRGWQEATDGRLYHPTITERVLEMVAYRDKEASRRAAYRERMQAERGTTPVVPPTVTRDTDGTVATGTGTGTREEKETSEAIASGAAAPPLTRNSEPEEIVYGYGVPFLTNAGTAEKQARSFLGKLCKDHGPPRVVDVLRDCIRAKPLQPLEWMAAVLPPKGKSALNSQEAIEASNKAVGARWLAKESHEAA